MKDYKANINYFTKWEGMKSCGMGMLIVGILFLWVAWVYWWFLYIVGMFLVVLGALFFFVGNAGRSDESDIMNEVSRKRDGIEFPEVEKERDFQIRMTQRPEILEFEGFCYREGLYLKKMKNGSLCSSEYSKARVLLLKDAFYIKSRTFSLVADELQEQTTEIAFTAVDEILLESDRKTIVCGQKSFMPVVSHLVICYDNGKKFRLLAKDDAYTDEVIVRLNKLVEKAKKGEL